MRPDDRRRLLLARIAVERAEMALVLSDARDALTPSRLVRDIAAGLWALLVRRRAAAAGPGAAALFGLLKNYPLLSSAVMALLPAAGGLVKRHVSVKRLLVAVLAAAAGWTAWRATRSR